MKRNLVILISSLVLLIGGSLTAINAQTKTGKNPSCTEQFRSTRCHSCGGTKNCYACQGRGYTTGMGSKKMTCRVCSGTGKCKKCGGTGKSN